MEPCLLWNACCPPSGGQRRTRETGSAMVETVIVLPVLLLIFFAIAEFGMLLGRFQTLNNAVREGARTAVVWRANCTVATVQSEVETAVTTYAAGGQVTLTPADITVAGACAGGGTNTTVTASYTFPFVILPNLAPTLSPSINLSASSVMRNEGA